MSLFGRKEKAELVDESLGVRVSWEEKHLRVIVGDQSTLYAGIGPEQFLKSYRESFEAIRLNFASTENNGQQLAFTAGEQDELRRDIALHWIRYYLVTKQEVRIEPKYLQHPQTWAIVLKKAEAKYGLRSPDAIALAAQTVGISYGEFETWQRVEDDRVNLM